MWNELRFTAGYLLHLSCKPSETLPCLTNDSGNYFDFIEDNESNYNELFWNISLFDL